MIYRGHVRNGMVVFEETEVPPEGAEVRVETVESPVQRTIADRLRNVIGIVDDLPSDMAEQHDHYIHGTPKRS